jgi:hypothetical protein
VSQSNQAQRRSSKLVPAAAILVGLFMLALLGWPHWHHPQDDYSVPVRALVVESTTLPVASALDRLWPRHAFAYHYLYQGELYVGRVYRHRGGLGEAVRRYPAGSMVTAWVDPDLPERAVIMPGPSSADLRWLAMGSLLFLLGLLGFARQVSRDKALPRAGDQTSTQRQWFWQRLASRLDTRSPR